MIEYIILSSLMTKVCHCRLQKIAQILNETYLHPFNWKARTTRKSFWWSTLINLVIGILCIILGFYAFNQNINPGIRIVDGIVAAIVYLWLFLAALGQTIRRLHDVGYSGYWYWAAFTGYGAMFLFYLELQPSVQRQVKWGKYFFSNQDYPAGHKETVPVPTIGQILKEHFFDCFKWNARSTRTSFWVGTAINQVTLGIGTLFIYAFSAFFHDYSWLASNAASNRYFLFMLFNTFTGYPYLVIFSSIRTHCSPLARCRL